MELTARTERCYIPFNTDAEYTGMQTGWHDSIPREVVSLSKQLGFSTPAISQSSPALFLNASLYEEFDIPKLPRKSAATTVRNIAKFRERRESLLSQRREMYDKGEQLLRDHIQEEKENFRKTNTSPDAHYAGFDYCHVDTRTYCKQCGATFFTGSKTKLRCRDCGWSKRERRARDNDEVLEMQGRDPDVFVTVGRGFHIEGESVDKETTVTPARHHPLVAKLKMKYSQFTVEQIVAHPDFHTDANTLAIQNVLPKDVAAQQAVKVTTFYQQTSRARRELQALSTPMDFVRRDLVGSRKDPIPVGFNVSICLNDRVELKHLGALTDPPETYLKALLRHQKTTLKDALKSTRCKARQNGWSKKMTEAEVPVTRARIEAAYRLLIERLERQITERRGALSGFPLNLEGRIHE
jgi:predicted  nucleic acid-binding Zn-ribbon protein